MANDLTIIYYTSNSISREFAQNTREHFLIAAQDYPIICVSHRKTNLGDMSENIVVNLPRHHLSIYKQALIGAENARTKYIAMAEDDVLYSPEHFNHRPTDGKFAYNVANWAVYTWNPSVYSWKGRRNLFALICERDLFIDAMCERFEKWPHDEDIDIGVWAEPGKYERHLGVTVRESEEFWTNPPNVQFSHYEALSFGGLGTRKRIGDLQAYDIPHWGTIRETAKLYKEKENKNDKALGTHPR